MNSKVIFSFIFVFAALGCFILGICIIFMDTFLFPAIHTNRKVGNITLKSGNAELDAIYHRAPQSRGVVLYSHGNREYLVKIRPWIDEFITKGYTILAYDYAGYGGSSGKEGTEQACRDIEAAYKFLTETEKFYPGQITVIGYSIGTGPSTWLAAKYPIRKLMLIAPFASASKAALPFDVPFNRFKNAEILSKKKIPLVLFHGTADKTVPYRNSLEINRRTIGKKSFFTYKGADHRNIFDRFKEDFWRELAK